MRESGFTDVAAKCKLVSATDFDLFEERLNAFLASLTDTDVIVDIGFATTSLGSNVEYSALVHYRPTEGWA